MRSFIGFLQGMTLLLVRLALGSLLVIHAWHRWHDVGMPGEISHLQAHGVPQPYLLAWGTVALEALGGALLLFGLFVPLVAALLLAQQVLTVVWIKWTNGLYPHQDGFENNLLLGLLALVLLFYGSGRAGLDTLLFRRRHDDERIAAHEAS